MANNATSVMHCEPSDFLSNPRDRDAAVARAVYHVFEKGQLEVPPEGCGDEPSVKVDFDSLNARILTPKSLRKGCIVYLAQKRHSSYSRDSLGMLERSLDLLYQNYNAEFRRDVLIFHNGEFSREDERRLRLDGSRNEIYLIEIPKRSRYWELPGFLDRKDANRWTDDAFSEGYRHMCRWYAEFVEKLGYEYVMRMDEDSYLLSSIKYDLFDFMQNRKLEYAYRLDAFEPCCDDDFRQRYIKAYLTYENRHFLRTGFLKDCCWDDAKGYLSYGYYNNFFITKTSFWRKPQVRRLFSFVDWTGGFYLFRENDLILQSLSVQLFMPKEKVYKFTDWSYEHVSGESCEWGAVVRGNLDMRAEPVDGIVANYMQHNKRTFALPSLQKKSGLRWDGLYCHKTNYRADVVYDLHRRTEQMPSPLGKAPYCLDLLAHDKKEKEVRVKIPRPRGLAFSTGDSLDRDSGQRAARIASRKFKQLFDRTRMCKAPSSASSPAPESGGASSLADLTKTNKRTTLHLEAPECGAGCTLNYLVTPLMHAMSTNQAFLTPDSLWAESRSCDGSQELSCFLKPFASRDDTDPACAKSDGPRYDSNTGKWRRIGQDDYGQWNGERKLSRTPTGFENFGIMWNVGQVLKNLLQFSPRVQQQLDKVVLATGLDRVENQPILGVHVRLGDSCSDPKIDEKGRRCDGLRYYIPAIRLLMRRFQFKSVYLATDSAEVVRNATKYYSDINWIVNPHINRDRYNVFANATATDEITIEGVLFGDKRLKKAGFSRTQEMVDFLVDTYILSKYASGFIGKFTSNMDRIVAALGAALGNDAGTCLKPLLSLDSDW
eukprot:CAMPEP_0171544546 /NCGR_PEP_ID=MMETSP0960-20121227/3565_1 /TAXON_ID=87120 /ORGANISM="Aurantiochytrium limacinum, Strain ATCCMYA-1381" /LENGTH=827 /DNA_ID=CAMNT_0012092375 /DNA_START=95 /DNA_END=2574 /DNA_ORIENTATION=+